MTKTIDMATLAWQSGARIPILGQQLITANGAGEEIVASGVGFDVGELFASAYVSRVRSQTGLVTLTLLLEHRDTDEDDWETAATFSFSSTSFGRAPVQVIASPKKRLRASWTVTGTQPRFSLTSFTVARTLEEGLPAGGSTGKVLAKASDDDFDVEWADGGGGVFPPDGWTVEPDVFQVEFAAIAAHLVLPLDEGNGGSIHLTAMTPGTGGNAITVTKLDPGPGVSLAVDVADTAITITLGTDGGGGFVSTGTDILEALAGNPDVVTLVSFVGNGNVDEIATPHASRGLLGGLAAYSAFLVRSDGGSLVTYGTLILQAPTIQFATADSALSLGANGFSVAALGMQIAPGHWFAYDAGGQYMFQFGDTNPDLPQSWFRALTDHPERDIFGTFPEDAEIPSWGLKGLGHEYLTALVAPADDDVANGQRLQWFDDTEDAPKLRSKQRDSAGTLSSGIAAAFTTKGILKFPDGGPWILHGTNDPTSSQDEIQQVDTQGSPDSGTYTLNLDGTDIGPINWDDDQAAVQAAYDDALTAAQATITGDAASHTAEFTDTLGNQDQPLMTVTDNSLTNTGDPVADPIVTVNQEGFALLAAPTSSQYMRDNSGAGELWLKIGASDGDWSQLAFVP